MTLLIKVRLDDFNISIDRHIIGLSADGCSTNVKYLKKLDKPFNLCLLHGLHIAISRVLKNGSFSEE